MSELNRRSFVLSAGEALTAKLAKADGTPTPWTAGQVVERIRRQVGVPLAGQFFISKTTGMPGSRTESLPGRGSWIASFSWICRATF